MKRAEVRLEIMCQQCGTQMGVCASCMSFFDVHTKEVFCHKNGFQHYCINCGLRKTNDYLR